MMDEVREEGYEAPAIEPLGNADELGTGNEGSPLDSDV